MREGNDIHRRAFVVGQQMRITWLLVGSWGVGVWWGQVLDQTERDARDMFAIVFRKQLVDMLLFLLVLRAPVRVNYRVWLLMSSCLILTTVLSPTEETSLHPLQ